MENFRPTEKIWLKNFQTLYSLQFMAYLGKALSFHRIRPVVVGGQAVEFYTAGGYSTGDIDLISPGQEVIARYLELAGFSRKGRYWYHKEVDLFVEVPGSALTSEEEEHLVKVETDEGGSFSMEPQRLFKF